MKPSVLRRPLVACCSCQRVQLGVGQFAFDDERLAAAGDNVSHTFCPSCASGRFGMSLLAYYEMYSEPLLPLEFEPFPAPATAA